MPAQIELSYLLKKNQKEDLFDSYLPVRNPLAGPTRFLTQGNLNQQADNAVLGIRVQQTPTKPVLHFLRLANAGGLSFPDQTQHNLQFKKVSFRVLSDLTDDQGRQVDFSISYEIIKRDYHIVADNALPQHRWLALVTRENGGFRFLHVKDDDDPGGGGDPCVLAGCNDPDRTIITAIACIAKGCG